MKTDRLTKSLLAVIAVLLAALLLDRSGLNRNAAHAADAPDVGQAFAHVDIIPAPFGFIMFDRKTGGVWQYQSKSEPGFPLARVGAGGTIAKPGDDVVPNK